jgi:hypothetical protein
VAGFGRLEESMEIEEPEFALDWPKTKTALSENTKTNNSFVNFLIGVFYNFIIYPKMYTSPRFTKGATPVPNKYNSKTNMWTGRQIKVKKLIL